MKERIAALVKSGDLNRATAIGGRPPDRKEKSGDPYFGGSRSAYTFAGEEIPWKQLGALHLWYCPDGDFDGFRNVGVSVVDGKMKAVIIEYYNP